MGPVVSIRVCRDIITRRSLGYAYVNFNNPEDAGRAIDLLNFTNLNGKPVRIMFSQRDPSTRKSGSGNIFIKNLDKDIDHKALHDTFAQFGRILSCKIETDAQGQSKGYGFVQFESDEAANDAIEKVNGMSIADKTVFVGHFVKRQERDRDVTVRFSNVFVKNLDEEVDDDRLREMFSKFGAITSCVVMRDDEGKSKCFGFVNFEEPESAMKAVEEMDNSEQDGKNLTVCRAQKKAEREASLRSKFEQERKERMEKMQGVNLYLKNLDDTVDDEKIREMFKEFGTITSCKVMRDPQGNSRGSGFVAFSSPEEATRAVTEMNGKMIGSKPLYVALAQRKEERRARLLQQFVARQGPGMPGMPMYPGMPAGPGGQMFYGQPGMPGMPMYPGGAPGMMPGVRPGMPGAPQYFMPMMQQRQGGGNRGRRNNGQQARQQGGQNLRYGPNVRNAQQAPAPAMQSDASAESGGSGSLAAQLAAAPPEQQRMIIGEALYPLVEAVEPTSAAKVTGMLLEMDQSEVLHLIESPDALQAKVAEAVAVLQAAAQQQASSAADGFAALSVGDN